MLYSRESKKPVVSIKPSQHDSQTSGYTMKRKSWGFLMFSVMVIDAGLTPI